MNTHRLQRSAQPQRGRLEVSAIITLCFLLAIPGYAVSRLSPQIDWRLLVSVVVALSAFAFFAYRSDKRSAEAGEWRVPEALLHLLELLGGWPGAFLVQRVFRHKTAKFSFQFIFWTIVFLHQFAAVDSLLDWRITKTVVRAIPS